MKPILIISLTLLILTSCVDKNNNAKYNINLKELKTLPTNFYGYRSGRVYLEDPNFKYSIWFDLDENGNVKKVFKVKNVQNPKDTINIINKLKIDTLIEKKSVQKFINLSRKYGFGHIKMDTINKCYFSTNEGILEEFVKTFNDSINNIYLKDKDFKLLKNGWFEKIRK